MRGPRRRRHPFSLTFREAYPMRTAFLAGALSLLLILGHGALHSLEAQVQTGQTGVINVGIGTSAVVTHPSTLERVMITNPDVADAVPVSAREVVINGLQAGTTTLLFWDQGGQRFTYSVRVTADVTAIQAEIDRMLPQSGISVTAVGSSIILTGEVTDPRTAARAVTLAESLSAGTSVLDYVAVPDPGQIMLQVRVAEVNRSAIERMGINVLYTDPSRGNQGAVHSGGVSSFGGSFPGTGPTQSFSDAVNFYLFHQSSGVAAFIQALQDEGVFRSLAEPNLITVPGETASFLAGGEFPYPMVQGQTGAVTVQFREFGIRLNFTPTIANSGAIRLEVEPEVSALDFASGVEVAGSRVPALLSRRAQTTVELEAGQTFAIAGLLDSQMQETVNKVPYLGDIPILGAFFRSREARENKTELLVLVTPQFVRPSDEMPEIPPGEADTWPWSNFMTRPLPVVTPPGTPDGSPDL